MRFILSYCLGIALFSAGLYHARYDLIRAVDPGGQSEIVFLCLKQDDPTATLRQAQLAMSELNSATPLFTGSVGVTINRLIENTADGAIRPTRVAVDGSNRRDLVAGRTGCFPALSVPA